MEALGARVPTRVVELSDGAELAAALGEARGSTVVAVGGDGTLHVVVQHLRDRGLLADTVLGLLPVGTGNDLARSVGIPLDAGAAAAVVLEGVARPLDLLVDDAGGVAVNAVHAGIGGLAAVRAAPLKPLLGAFAYRAAAAWAGARARGWRVRVEVDGRALADAPVLVVAVGNGATIGGGTLLWPGARPDDGLADVMVAPAGGLVSRLALAGALRSGDPRRVPGVVFGRGASVRVVGEAMPYNADGEALGPYTGRSWRVERGHWRLLVPSSH